MAQSPRPDATSGEATDAERVAPLKWLRYSRERFRTLMRMLAARAARSEIERAEAKAAEEARQAAEAKAAEDAQRAEAKRAAEAKTAADSKSAAEARRVAEAKRAEEAQRAAEAKRAAEVEAAADAKAAEEARRVAEARAEVEAAQRAAEAKRAADSKVAEEAKREAEAKAAPPAAEPGKRPTCPNAGVRVAGAGWYVVERGDSLWSIARMHYGRGRTWRHIHAANRNTIANPRLIYPCQRIYIPRGGRSEAPLQGLRAALEAFMIRRRAIDTALPAFAVD